MRRERLGRIKEREEEHRDELHVVAMHRLEEAERLKEHRRS